MKTFVKTSCYWDNTAMGGQGSYLPDLDGYEKDADINYSLFKINFPTEILVRVSGPQLKILAISKPTIDDNQALTTIQATHPNSDLTNINVRDKEVDDILIGLSYNPDDVRRASGNTLKDQEYGAMKKIADLKGKDISDLMKGIKKGKCDAYEKALMRLR